jgi:hypothetical protein
MLFPKPIRGGWGVLLLLSIIPLLIIEKVLRRKLTANGEHPKRQGERRLGTVAAKQRRDQPIEHLGTRNPKQVLRNPRTLDIRPASSYRFSQYKEEYED